MAGIVTRRRLEYFSRELTTEGTLNVLLVSTSQSYLDQLGEALYVTKEVQKSNRTYKLKVHTCKSISDVLHFMPKDFYVDFIVFLLDVRIGNCLNQVESNLTWIDSSFPKDKVCLVNPEPAFASAMVLPFEIWDFAKQHQLNLVNGKIKKENGVFNLSRSILNLAEACCGLLNGIPMVNII